MAKAEQDPELLKCYESPWYFATKYIRINGKPFTTNLTEEEFNELYSELQTGLVGPYLKKRK